MWGSEWEIQYYMEQTAGGRFPFCNHLFTGTDPGGGGIQGGGDPGGDPGGGDPQTSYRGEKYPVCTREKCHN